MQRCVCAGGPCAALTCVCAGANVRMFGANVRSGPAGAACVEIATLADARRLRTGAVPPTPLRAPYALPGTDLAYLLSAMRCPAVEAGDIDKLLQVLYRPILSSYAMLLLRPPAFIVLRTWCRSVLRDVLLTRSTACLYQLISKGVSPNLKNYDGRTGPVPLPYLLRAAREIGYGLRCCYGKCGTEVGYGATGSAVLRQGMGGQGCTWRAPRATARATATPCHPMLSSYAIILSSSAYAISLRDAPMLCSYHMHPGYSLSAYAIILCYPPIVDTHMGAVDTHMGA
eukprot:3000930-Rhodomonas_salina.1